MCMHTRRMPWCIVRSSSPNTPGSNVPAITCESELQDWSSTLCTGNAAAHQRMPCSSCESEAAPWKAAKCPAKSISPQERKCGQALDKSRA